MQSYFEKLMGKKSMLDPYRSSCESAFRAGCGLLLPRQANLAREGTQDTPLT
jgi:hypothetical protein